MSFISLFLAPSIQAVQNRVCHQRKRTLTSTQCSKMSTELLFCRHFTSDIEHGISNRADVATKGPHHCNRSGQAENVLAFAGRFAQRGGGMREILDVDARQRGGEGVL